MAIQVVTKDDIAGEGIVGAGRWELVEGGQSFDHQGNLSSNLLTLRVRIGQGFLVRTLFQVYGRDQYHVTMSQCYVPDPNENWVVGE